MRFVAMPPDATPVDRRGQLMSAQGRVLLLQPRIIAGRRRHRRRRGMGWRNENAAAKNRQDR
jgi:hypothetical protein